MAPGWPYKQRRYRGDKVRIFAETARSVLSGSGQAGSAELCPRGSRKSRRSTNCRTACDPSRVGAGEIATPVGGGLGRFPALSCGDVRGPLSRRSAAERQGLEVELTELFEQGISFKQTLGLKVVTLALSAPTLRLNRRPERVGHPVFARLLGGRVGKIQMRLIKQDGLLIATGAAA